MAFPGTLLLVTALFVLANGKLPFKTCKRSNPHLNKCLQDAIQATVPIVVKGLPSLGVSSIDPLAIKQLIIDQGSSSGPVSIRLQFNDIQLRGIGSAKITNVKADWDKYYLKFEASLAKPIILTGLYKVVGKVLVLPIQGDGNCNITLENVKGKIELQGKELKKNGKLFMNITDFSFKFSTSRLHIKLDNLFNGDKTLGDNMNLFLNENWSIMLQELQPAVEEALSQTFIQISNRFFLKIPIYEIAPQ